MNRGAVADFARFRAEHPKWTITRVGTGLRAFEARKGGVVVRGATFAELAARIAQAEAARPS